MLNKKYLAVLLGGCFLALCGVSIADDSVGGGGPGVRIADDSVGGGGPGVYTV